MLFLISESPVALIILFRESGNASPENDSNIKIL